MKTSEAVGEIFGALSKAQGEFTVAKKTKTNPFFGSKYADLSTVIESTRPSLVKHGLTVFQFATSDEAGVFITTVIGHSSGQWIQSPPLLVPVASRQDKKTGQLVRDAHCVASAVTYGKRVSLSAAIGVVAEDEDDDGNAAVTAVPLHARIPTSKQDWHPVDGPPPPSDADMPPDVDAIPQQAEGTQRRFKPDGGFVDSPLVPFGRDKGKTLAEVDKRTLEWLFGIATQNIADPSKAKWAAKERVWLGHVEAELARRQQ